MVLFQFSGCIFHLTRIRSLVAPKVKHAPVEVDKYLRYNDLELAYT